MHTYRAGKCMVGIITLEGNYHQPKQEWCIWGELFPDTKMMFAVSQTIDHV